ncbi:Gag-asp_proteas domain-containing protein [Quillaja saponaria]|uniref:Gag-asp_proteas domain-containing protein n=1 Tax=Quillaja saponaria TaxID=32244 RepID=A0AAD7PME0_QUISA|nr:Gag-asp_proteas domain-containing protein [Quillaja saponaria]
MAGENVGKPLKGLESLLESSPEDCQAKLLQIVKSIAREVQALKSDLQSKEEQLEDVASILKNGDELGGGEGSRNYGEAVIMVDAGATHNFISERKAVSLGLKVAKNTSKIKAANSDAQAVLGMAYNINVKIGEWRGKIHLLVVPLDDFDIIFGNAFLVKAWAAVIPYLGGILVMDDKQPCFVAGNRDLVSGKSKDKKTEMVSAVQIGHRWKKWEITYLAALIEVKPDRIMGVPHALAEVLREFKDVMARELTKTLPHKGSGP